MRIAVVLIACATAVASCHHNGGTSEPSPEGPTEPSPPPPPVDPSPRIVLRPEGAPPVTLAVEVQRTNAARERGLMRRAHLDELAGMIFVFPVPEHQVFWMHDTFLPLDMLFITSEHRVLGIVANATPMTDDERGVPGDSQYVLEVRAGFAERHHIVPGTVVDFVNIPPAVE